MTRRYRLLTDEHLPNSVVELLRREGWEVQRVLDVLGKGTDDRDIFPYAAKHGLVWVTSDERAQKWPSEYLKEGLPFVGMIVWTQQSRYDMRPGEFMRQLEALEREAEPFAYGFRHIKPE